MGSSSPSLLDQRRKMKAGLSKRMKREAVSRQCRACGRKMATRRIVVDGIVIGRVCRYCKHEVTNGAR